MTLFRIIAFTLFTSLVFGYGHIAQAQQGLLPSSAAVDVNAGVVAGEETHPPLRLTPDKSEILLLDENVTRVIIGSDVHLNLMMDTPNRIIAVPREPGATHFTLLGEEGRVLMQRHVIVADPEQKYIRIREACPAGNCEPLRMFYCPDMCHEIDIPGAAAAAAAGGAIMGDGAVTGGTAGAPSTAAAGGLGGSTGSASDQFDTEGQ